jgi:hypothetical protein
MTLSTRAQIVTRRTYNRPLNEEGTVFETWEETVERVISHQKWLWERAKTHATMPEVALRDVTRDMTQEWVHLSEKEVRELQELRQLLLDKKLAVSGRTLWLGGTWVSQNREASQFNCLKRSTRFITKQGIKSFEEFEDGDTVTVLTPSGAYIDSVVHKYGVQPLNKITLKRSGKGLDKVVYATPDHRWIKKGVEVTTDLRVGDYLDYQKFSFWDSSWDSMTVEEQLWWCYGFVYGDGALSKSGGSVTSRVRLCGDKTKYLNRFSDCGFNYSYPPSCNEDPFVYTGKYLKTLPDLSSDNINSIAAFLRGWIDADGGKNSNYTIRGTGNIYDSIQITGEESIEFFRNAAAACGLHISSESNVSNSTTNYGSRSNTTIKFMLNSYFNNTWMTQYKVTAIENTGLREEVWCLEVPGEQAFILEGGIVTGNCAFTNVETIYDLVDLFWLLLQGCGVGLRSVSGTLTGFRNYIPELEIIRSKGSTVKGRENNLEHWDSDTRTWTINVGDSAEAWAKSIGKLVAGKYPANKLVLDFSEIRKEGLRLKNYGWISQGDKGISAAYTKIFNILNAKADSLLSEIDILDIANLLGTVLSTRRSAEIAVMDSYNPVVEEFAKAKAGIWEPGSGLEHRAQSNNSIIFWDKPSRKTLSEYFWMINEGGNGEPGLINGKAMKDRAPWAVGLNPCA